MVAKDLSTPSKCNVSIYNVRLDGDKRPFLTIQMDGQERSFTTIRWTWMVSKTFHNHSNTKAYTETDAEHEQFFSEFVL